MCCVNVLAFVRVFWVTSVLGYMCACVCVELLARVLGYVRVECLSHPPRSRAWRDARPPAPATLVFDCFSVNSDSPAVPDCALTTGFLHTRGHS